MSDRGKSEWRRHVVIAHPLAVVTAAFHHYMSEEGINIRYEQVTSGNAFFVLYSDHTQENELGTIYVQAATVDRTSLEIFVLPQPSNTAESRSKATRLILAYFILWLEKEYTTQMDRLFEETKQYMVELEHTILPTPEDVKALLGHRRGRNTDKDNDWARRQLALGVDDERVFEEWARRKGYDLNNSHSRRKAHAAFRQMKKSPKKSDSA